MVAERAPSRGSPTAIPVGDLGIHASVACMEAEIESRGEGLVMFIPTSRDASRSSSNNNRGIGMPIPSTRMGEETAVLVCPPRVPPGPPVVPSTTAKGIRRALFISSISVTSTAIGDRLGGMHDSETTSGVKVDTHAATVGHRIPSNPAQAPSQCTEIDGKRSRITQNTHMLPDFNELPCPSHVIKVGAQDSCKYVNIEQSSRTTQNTRMLPDFNELPCPSHVIKVGAQDSFKYVNIEQSKVKHNLCNRDAYHGPTTQNSCGKEVHCTAPYINCSSKARPKPADFRNSLCRGPSPGCNMSNWLNAVKPEVNCPPPLGAEDSWPPLLASSMQGDTLKQNLACDNSQVMILSTGDAVQPLIKASNGHKNTVFFGKHANTENLPKACTTPPHGNREELLDEHCWPSLEKSCRRSDLQYDYGSSRERTLQPLSSSNFHSCPVIGSTVQGQKRNGGLPKRENMHMRPILLMLNKDFIVTSPLKENLLLTLALMGRRPTAVQSQLPEGEAKRQILVGQFKAFSSFLHFMLGRDATRVRTESNAGGTSTISESLSVEYFVRRFQAKDIVTEMEVEYCSFNWKKVDYICTLYGQRVGVSVTRAMSFPDPKDFSAQMAYRLLYKKLFGLVVARHGVSKRHSFSQCILHVWCETQQTASIMQREYDGVSQELDIADDVVMVLTVADGSHARPIFYESILRNASQ